MSVRAEDFPRFFEAVNHHPPFPWQSRLLETVLADGWPSVIDLPTGSGKTAVIDVATYALAVQADPARGPRTTPMRIALVVDRRIVVDLAFERAKALAQHLLVGDSAIGREVAHALRSYGAEVPLRTALLRGGIYREDRFARQPNQPAILCSTVDQVGSRLLHRGYGLSSRMWPIHAGLLGEDALLVLDEAHASVPFGQTLTAIASMRARREAGPDRPWSFVEMTATSRRPGRHFKLDHHDLAHAVLSRRLNARKPIHLVTAPKKGSATLVKTLCAAVTERADTGKTVLCVVNRVATARAVHQTLDKLSRKKKAGIKADVLLLTGRSRSIDRDGVLERWSSRLMAGRRRTASAEQRALIVVATQCVEVGADFDVDALVSEAAPLDSLRQRLGRLDRLGELGSAPCTLVCPSEQAWGGEGEPPRDFVYGQSTARTWALLTDAAAQRAGGTGLDGGSLALVELSGPGSEPCVAPTSSAPTMLPAHCDLWAQTQPPPMATPEPALFLHGPQAAEPDVQLVFRGDLDGVPPERWLEVITLAPPVSAEALPLRISTARAWLAQERKKLDDSGDVAGVASSRANPTDTTGFRATLSWRGPAASSVIEEADALRPGMTLVVPTSYGGCDEFGWAPLSTDPVIDRADVARVLARRAPALRLVPELDADWPASVHALAQLDEDEAPDDLDERVDVALFDLAASASPQAPMAAALVKDAQCRVERHPSGRGVVIVGRSGWAAGASDFTDEDESSSLAPAAQALADHLGRVRDQAAAFARGAGLAEDLAEDLALAGWLHDLGKADPRFQAWLHEGNRVEAKRAGLLAKSTGLAVGVAARRRSRELAGYPAGGRHELLSVRLAESRSELLSSAHDLDLVLHLVESHHGFCRPFAPAVHDAAPLNVMLEIGGAQMGARTDTGLERLDAGPAQRFHRLLRRYGHWGLAYLEACLRLADHRASEAAETREAT